MKESNDLMKKEEQAAERKNEIMGEDGLLRCSVCGGKLETIVRSPLGTMDKVRCVCQCTKAERERWQERQRIRYRESRRRICFNGTNMAGWNFAADDMRNPEISEIMRKYADLFPEYWREGKGLLLYGTVGTGKTYYAACIANAVIDRTDRDYRVFMTNFAEIADALSGTWDKAEYINDLMSYDLLIIDDLGAERKSEYMQEQVWKITDARYRSGLPLIVTTNLTAEEIDKGDGIGNKRIYSRLLEHCLAVEVKGKDRRRENARREWASMREQLGIGGA